MDKKRKLYTIPTEDGFHMPAEYEKHKGCLMIWPWRPGSWGKDSTNAKKAFAEVAKAIAESEILYMIIREEDYAEAMELLANTGDRMKLIIADSDDAWARDTGATFVINQDRDELRALDWEFNAWGGEYDGLYASWEKDNKIAEIIAEQLEADIYDTDSFVLEGGSIHVDGEGTLITTEECLLSPGRNPNMNRTQIEEMLMKYLGLSKVIWLEKGIYNDETNGHVDNFCCFCAPGEVILAWTDDEKDPQYIRSKNAYDILSSVTDAKGRRFKIHKLPIPQKPVCITKIDLENYVFEEGEDERECGERLAASYVNFYISNDAVVVPQFGDVNDDKAIEILGECFPTRRVVGIDAMPIIKGGGNIHCITQQIPELSMGISKEKGNI